MPQLGEALQFPVGDGHETVVVEADLADVGKALPGRLDLVDQVAGAGVADLLVVDVVGDELGVAAEAAVERAADRPQRLVAEPVVVQVVGKPDGAEALAPGVDPLALAVLGEGERLHLFGCHQRQKVVADLVVVALLEPEVAQVAVVGALLQPVVQLLEGELALAGADGVDIGGDGVLGVDDRVDAAPEDEGGGIQLPQPADDLAGELGVAGHRGEADQIGAGQAVGDPVDVGVVELTLGAVGALHEVPDAAVPLGRHVVRLGVGVQPGDICGDLAEAVGRDPVFERDHLYAHRGPLRTGADDRGRDTPPS